MHLIQLFSSVNISRDYSLSGKHSNKLHNNYGLDTKFVTIVRMMNQQFKNVHQIPALLRILQKDDGL